MPIHVRALLWPLALAVVAVLIFDVRIRRDMDDFDVYRVAAGRALASEPLYREEDGHYKFKYLPAFAIMMAPFTGLEPQTAKALWFAVSVGLLAAFVRWSVYALPDRRRSERALMVVAVVLMAKFYGHELTLGQSNILLGTVLVTALLAVKAGRSLVAGALFGLAVFVKPYAIILLPWVAFSCGLAAALVSGGVVLAGLLLPVATYGWTGNLDLLSAWYRTVTSSTASTLVGGDNISLAGMWGKWLGAGAPATILATVSGLGMLGLAVAIWFRRRAVAAPDYLEVALLMLLVPLLSPQGWDYVLLLATPAVVVLVDRWGDLGLAWRGLVAASLAVMGLTLYDVMGRSLYARFMALSFVSVCAILVAVSLAHVRWKALA
jgi:Glycosyltransferase family 87